MSLVSFPSLLALSFLPLVIFISGVCRGRLWQIIVAFLFLLLLLRFIPGLERLIIPIFAAILLWGVLFRYYCSEFPGTKQEVCLLFILLFVVVGFSLRWPLLIERVGNSLDPDAQGYLNIARNGKGLFQTSCDTAPYIREPLFIWFVRAAFFIFRTQSDTALRFLTVLLSLFVIPATYFAGRRWFGRFPALLAAFFYTVNPYFTDMSVRGLRMELYMVCVLLFLAGMDWLRKKEAWGGIRSGVASGVCLLARITSLSFTIPLTVFFGIRRKAKAYQIILAVAVSLVLLTPHLIFNYQITGDPLFSSNIHARFYRNREFAGQPGFPSKQEVSRDPYCGKPITSLEYIFGLHSPFEVVKITLRGFFRIFLGRIALGGLFGGNRVFFLFYLFGLGVTLFSRRWEWVVAAIVLEAPSVFLAGLHLDWRLTLHVAPLLYLFTANGIFFLAKKANFVRQKYTLTKGA